MTPFAVLLCARLTSAGLASQCSVPAAIDGIDVVAFQSLTAEENRVLTCAKGCSAVVERAARAGWITIPLPKHKTFILLVPGTPAEVAGDFVAAAQRWDDGR